MIKELILATIIIILGVALILTSHDRKNTISANEAIYSKLDSLIKVNEKYNKLLNLKLDSLNNNKTIINNTYNKIYENFSNPSITSDDSIASYISSKIQNKR